MKHLKLFENWTYDKILDKFDSDEELEELIAKYIYWKRGNEQKDIVVSEVCYRDGKIWANYFFSEIDTNGNYSTSFRIDDPIDFDKFAKNADVFIEQEKYNL